MDNPSSRLRLGSLHRPQVYVKVEFGVSWSQRQAPNNHGLTYRSRNLRERLPNFPRQVPATNTNYLAGLPPPSQGSSFLLPDDGPRQPRHFLQDIEEREERRSSRDSRSSHERGRSAPPPINNSPWDITQLDASAFPSSSSRAAAAAPMPDDALWKELPEVPTRFRLGEDGMPWSAWSWPYDYDPDMDSRGPSPGQGPAPRVTAGHASSSALATTARSPHEAARDAARNRELEALSAAMVTVDNGFENQWWNQGDRETTAAVVMSANMAGPVVTTPPPAYEPGHGQNVSVASLGWAIASERPADRTSYAAAVAASHGVSPLTAATDLRSPPPPLYQQALTRSMSTRSEELFMDGGRWG